MRENTPAAASNTTLYAVLCVTVAALGVGTARRRVRRASRRRAVRAAYGRLVGEWCDLYAHHLAAVVVSADTARRLGGDRPELTEDARTLAVRTGRETLTALRRLVAARPPDGPHGAVAGSTGHGAVLRATSRMVSRAEEGRLDDVAVEARAALTALREVAGTLRPDPETVPETVPGTAPLPTAADIGDLCRARRAAGRHVTLHAPPEAVAELPAAVGLSAFRLVEEALGAGDTGAARVVLERSREELAVTVTGVPAAAAGPVAELLRLRSEAAGGRADPDPTGVVRVRLPIGPDRPADR